MSTRGQGIFKDLILLSLIMYHYLHVKQQESKVSPQKFKNTKTNVVWRELKDQNEMTKEIQVLQGVTACEEWKRK